MERCPSRTGSHESRFEEVVPQRQQLDSCSLEEADLRSLEKLHALNLKLSFSSDEGEEKVSEFYMLKRSDWMLKWTTRRFLLQGTILAYWRPVYTKEYVPDKPDGIFDIARGVATANAAESLLWISLKCHKVKSKEPYILELKAVDRASLVSVLKMVYVAGCTLDAFLLSLAGINPSSMRNTPCTFVDNDCDGIGSRDDSMGRFSPRLLDTNTDSPSMEQHYSTYCTESSFRRNVNNSKDVCVCFI